MAMAAILSAAIALPVQAASCHHYSRWYYPWPQRCGVKVASRVSTVANRFATVRSVDPAIALPSLAKADLRRRRGG